jgi:hypothetical protein
LRSSRDVLNSGNRDWISAYHAVESTLKATNDFFCNSLNKSIAHGTFLSAVKDTWTASVSLIFAWVLTQIWLRQRGSTPISPQALLRKWG